MALIAKNSGTDFKLPPAGTHVGICYMLVDIGTHLPPPYGDKPPKPTRQVVLGFELCHELMDDGRPFAVSNFYTLSLHEKANLRKDLEAWRGRAFTDDELAGFDLKKVVGCPCLLSVVHEMKKDTTRANIGGIMAMTKGSEPAKQVNPCVIFDIDEWDHNTFESLPEWLRNKILSSDEGKARNGEPVSNPTPNGNPLNSPLHRLPDGTMINYTDKRHPDFIPF